jgi:hypothetical protein
MLGYKGGFKPIIIHSKKAKGLSVELSWDCQEGWSGDYDPKDPDDEPLLRFDVCLNGRCFDDGSYCTQLRATDPRRKLFKAARAILSEAEDSISNGCFKRTMEWMSWISVDDIHPGPREVKK